MQGEELIISMAIGIVSIIGGFILTIILSREGSNNEVQKYTPQD